MHEAGLVAVELHAGLAHGRIKCEGREPRQDVIGVLRQDEAHIDAAQGRVRERGAQRGVGHEIRAREPEALSRGADHLEIHGRAGIPDRRRRAGNDGCGHVSGSGVDLPRELRNFPRDEIPILDERELQRDGNGALEPHEGIAPRPELRVASHVFVADVLPADEGDAAIGDDELAMIAEVETKALSALPIRHEGLEPHAALAQRLPKCGWQLARADLVDEHAHAHAARAGSEESLLDVAPELVVADDEKLDEQVIPRLVDGLADGGEGFRAVDEELGLIAARDRQVREALGEVGGVAVFLGEIGGVGKQRGAGLFKHAGERGIVRVAGELVTAEGRAAEDREERQRKVREEQESEGPADRGLRRARNEDGLESAQHAGRVEEHHDARNENVDPHAGAV